MIYDYSGYTYYDKTEIAKFYNNIVTQKYCKSIKL